MGKSSFRRAALALTGLCLVFAVADSCTFDYFEDETNFRLYVPQIERGEIKNFYVSFHEVGGGGHVYTRKVSAPFELITDGILKFHILPGYYNISTFADYDNDVITEGNHFSESYKGAKPFEGRENTYVPGNSQTRALFLRDITVYPIGHPDAPESVEADIDAEHRFKGSIICRFRDLPAGGITRIAATYKGPSTRFDFDGGFRRFDQPDIYRHEFLTAANSEDNDVVCASLIYPSTGEVHTDAGVTASSTGGEEIELQIDFYNGEAWAGGTTLTSADLAALDDEAKPVDADGNRVEDLVLRPRKTIAFLFKGFTLVGVGLEPWGPIEDGGFDIH
jgi:hypothetical protein